MKSPILHLIPENLVSALMDVISIAEAQKRQWEQSDNVEDVHDLEQSLNVVRAFFQQISSTDYSTELLIMKLEFAKLQIKLDSLIEGID